MLVKEVWAAVNCNKHYSLRFREKDVILKMEKAK